MTRIALPLVAALALAGCNTLTPQQAAVYTQAFCVVSADGAALAVSLTKGGAQATAQKIGAAQPVACDAATMLGQVVATKKP